LGLSMTMQRLVQLFCLSCLSLAVLGGMVDAEAATKKRQQSLFERLFGNSKDSTERKRFRKDEKNRTGTVRIIRESPKTADTQKKKKRAKVVETRPGPTPGPGMGNLIYVAPRLVPMASLTFSEARPSEAQSAAIFDQLTGNGASLRVLPATRDALADQYRSRAFRPVWIEDGRLTARGAKVLAVLASAAEEGLIPETYLPTSLASFDAPLPTGDPAAMARLDIDLYAAALRYAQDASGGQFDPRRLSLYHDVTPQIVPAEQAARVLAWSPYAAEYVLRLHPVHPAYQAMKRALADVRTRAASAPIPIGRTVRKGGRDDRLPDIRMRLVQLGYPNAAAPLGTDPDYFDESLAEELSRFQKASGIRASGTLGPNTVRALNDDDTTQQLAILLNNMERLRWLPGSLGTRHVFVNQAAYAAEVRENGRKIWSTRVIVGKPDTQTWALHDEMELVVFNPSWGIPQSIFAKKYLPQLRRDPGYLDRIGYTVVNQSGKKVSSRKIRWGIYGSTVPFGILQPPGKQNAMGEIKFLFPNNHDIYMHDTPQRELFDREVRAFSAGCVRVENPREFASVLLGWNTDEVAQHIATPGTETIRLKEKIPVHLTYFTAWPDDEGRIVFFDDIYARDKTMIDARNNVVIVQRNTSG
jgi:L,D-transpeptidase YcbB